MKSVVDKLSKDGRIKKAYLGVILNMISLPSDIIIQQQLNETHRQGLMVVSVENGTPAKRAGLLMGDVIVKFNKEPVIMCKI
jgi:S1-C subfamily serine protease